jgi:hypothetical protein
MLKTVSTQLALASDTLPEVLAKGNTTGGTDLAVSSGDDVTFADSSKAIFGAGSDLEIYSDGTAGLIKVNTVYGLGDITITQSADNKGIAILDSTESGAFYLRHNAANTFISNNDTRDMILATNSFDRLTLDGTTGDATFSGNLVIGTSGNGIDFSATAGTGTSELLDDYEEGNWTPGYSFATPGDSAFTYTGGRLGTYTKVGNLVTCFFYLDNVTVVKGTASGDLLLTGLPYTVAGNTNYSGGVVVMTDSYPIAPQSFIAFTGTTTTGLRTAGGAAGITATNFAASNTVYLRGVIQYQV